MTSLTAPPPFDTVCKPAHGSNIHTWPLGEAVYWDLPDPHDPKNENGYMYLFPPAWDGNWHGVGYWRIGKSDWGTKRSTTLCGSPEELWALYLGYTLTGEW